MPGKTQARRPLPEVCPVLTAPDQKGRENIVPCLGSRCALFRTEVWDCALLELPRHLGSVKEAIAVMRRVTSGAIDRASESAQEKIGRALTEFEGSFQRVLERLGGIEKDLGGGVARATEAFSSATEFLGKAEGRLGEIVGELSSEVGKLKEAERLEAAGKAADAALSLIRSGSPETACTLLESSMDQEKRTPYLLNAFGCAHLTLGNHEEAAKAFQEALDLDPRLASAHVNLGLALLSIGRHLDAEETLREGLRLAPESGAGWNTLGNLLFSTGRRREAVDAWTAALEKDPALEAAAENLRRQQVVVGPRFDEMIAATEPAHQVQEGVPAEDPEVPL